MKPSAEFVKDLSGAPGTRMPHVALDDVGTSTLDLPGDRPLLVTADPEWAGAARALADSGAPLDIASPEGEWQTRCGVERDGAILVRPDGFVAWRARDGKSASRATLSRVLNTVLGAPDRDDAAH